jgi:hypothetical protein
MIPGAIAKRLCTGLQIPGAHRAHRQLPSAQFAQKGGFRTTIGRIPRTKERSMTPKEQKLYDWVKRTGMVLEKQVVGSGLDHQLNSLLRSGHLDIVAHPTVLAHRDPPAPAAAVVLKT